VHIGLCYFVWAKLISLVAMNADHSGFQFHLVLSLPFHVHSVTSMMSFHCFFFLSTQNSVAHLCLETYDLPLQNRCLTRAHTNAYTVENDNLCSSS
jgi:hypothetical protein